MSEATTVTLYPVPGAERFIDPETGGALEFLPAPDLESIKHRLIDQFDDKFGFMAMLRVPILWKAEGGEKAGHSTLGKCQKPSGLLRLYSQADFIIWLAADHCFARRMTERQVEAIVFHEMRHIRTDGMTGLPMLVGHDFERFFDEVAEYGFENAGMEQIRQMALFEATGQRPKLELVDDLGSGPGERDFADKVAGFFDEKGIKYQRNVKVGPEGPGAA